MLYPLPQISADEVVVVLIQSKTDRRIIGAKVRG